MNSVRAVAVLPVKRLTQAKTRLAVPARTRQMLAAAFALDTLAAVRRCPGIEAALVVTSDPRMRLEMSRRGVDVVDEPMNGGLQRAVEVACSAARLRYPGRLIAVVPADLPALRPEALTDVLDACEGDSVFVPDARGDGTTLLLSPPDCRTANEYGPLSASRHRAAGVREMIDAPLPARHDVDHLDDLAAAYALGLGRATTSLVARLRLTAALPLVTPPQRATPSPGAAGARDVGAAPFSPLPR
jgi:2-phospho-L-lactate guanylyltransferase